MQCANSLRASASATPAIGVLSLADVDPETLDQGARSAHLVADPTELLEGQAVRTADIVQHLN
jgi:hypothetical protein